MFASLCTSFHPLGGELTIDGTPTLLGVESRAWRTWSEKPAEARGLRNAVEGEARFFSKGGSHKSSGENAEGVLKLDIFWLAKGWNEKKSWDLALVVDG